MTTDALTLSAPAESADQLDGIIKPLQAHWFVASIALAAALLLVGAIARLATPDRRARSVTSLICLTLGTTLVGVAGTWWLLEHNHWSYLLAFLPPAIVCRQAVYLRLVRRRTFYERVDRAQFSSRPRDLDEDEERLAKHWQEARHLHDREFSTDTLAVRFGVPALLSLLLGLALVWVLSSEPSVLHLPPRALLGARYGAAGAYTYVLLFLGQRAIKRDVTSGAAMGSTVTLVAGPLMGAVVALVWLNLNEGATADQPWSHKVLFFVAGLAPREAANAVQEAARRLWQSSSGAVAPSPKVLPLSQVHGIGTEIAQRLEEEGVADVYALAMADPLKLFRNTNFDKRQILGWMDEALLLYYAAPWAERLGKVGIFSMIDVAYHAAGNGKSSFDALCEAAGIPEPERAALRAAGTRLYEDGQVALLWALYQTTDDEHATYEEADSAPLRLRTPLRDLAGEGAPVAILLLCAVVLAAASVLAWDVRLRVTQLGWMLAFGATSSLAGALLAVAWVAFHGSWKKKWIVVPIVLATLLLSGAGPAWYSGYCPLGDEGPTRVDVGVVLLAAALVSMGALAFRAVWARTQVSLSLTLVYPDGATPESPSFEIDGVPAKLTQKSGESGQSVYQGRVRRGRSLVSVRIAGVVAFTKDLDARFGLSVSEQVELEHRARVLLKNVEENAVVDVKVDGEKVPIDARSRMFDIVPAATTRRVTITVAGYRPLNDMEVECPSGSTTILYLPRLDPLPGVVRLSLPDPLPPDVALRVDGTVLLRGVEKGASPVMLELRPGHREIVLEAPEHSVQRFEAEILPGGTWTIEAQPFQQRMCAVTLVVDDHPKLRVLADGVEVPLVNKMLKVDAINAPKSIIVDISGYQPDDILQRIKLEPGGQQTIPVVVVKRQ